MLVPLAVAAEPWIDEVPEQRDEPFAAMTVGARWDHYLPSSPIPLPAADGSFEEATAAFDQAMIEFGAMHFHGHAEWWVGIPVWARPTPLGGHVGTEDRSVDTGVRWYPWTAAPGSVRPYASLAIGAQGLCVVSDDATASVGCPKRLVVPAGVGLAWRTPWHVLVDASAEYVRVAPVPVAAAGGDLADPRTLELSGLTFGAGVRLDADASAWVLRPEFRGEAADRMERLAGTNLLSGLELGVGPSGRILAQGSPYWTELRPAIAATYDEDVFAHVVLGYYNQPWDAVVRASFRSFPGVAEGYGVRVETLQQGGFVEGFRLFDLHFYGFVPFLGAGAGYERLVLDDPTVGVDTFRVVPSVVFGWDIRPDPSEWWLLRTGFRWIPAARVPLDEGRAYDFGGVEYDFIQLILYPARLVGRYRRGA